MSIRSTLRLGIIGCGQIVETAHVAAILASGRFEIRAVADISARRGEVVAAAVAVGGRPAVYIDHRAMLEHEDLDVVLIATPPGIHRAQALDVIASGRHVLCEKPIATTLADADAIVEASEATGARCLMVHNYASFEEHERVCELIGQGIVGRLQTVVLEGLGSYPWDGVPEFRPGWRYDSSLAGGGRLLDAGIHALYLAEMFFGRRPTGVSADLSFSTAGPPADVRCFARYRFGDGLGVLHIGEGQGGCRVEAIGEEGRVELRYADGLRFFNVSPTELRAYRDGVLITSEAVVERSDQVTAAFYGHVHTRLTAPRAYAHSARHGRDLLESVLATYLSAHERRQVEIAANLPCNVYGKGASALWV